MTIWLLALILMASLAGIGYRQGAIRVAFSLVGIFFAALLAVPVGKLVMPAVKAMGAANPIWLWLIPPFVAFCVILTIFKMGGLAMHKKVDVYYKYKAGDLRLALFERINARLGLCLGLVNGMAYLILLTAVIHVFSYWTIQIASNSGDAKMLRLMNQMGRDLQSTGMNKVAGAITSFSPTYYDAADMVGLIYHNPLLEARLSRYPGFISLGMRPDFQQLGTDGEFQKMRLTPTTTLNEFRAQASVSPIINNPDTLREIWNTAKPDLKDLEKFLREAKTDKYNEPIIGHWSFDPASTTLALRRDKPKIAQQELVRFKQIFRDRFARTTLIAAPDGKTVLKNVPQLKVAQNTQPNDSQVFEGKWVKSGDNYELSFSGAEGKPAKIDGGRMTTSYEGLTIVFFKED